jgi:hypothetical protein
MTNRNIHFVKIQYSSYLPNPVPGPVVPIDILIQIYLARVAHQNVCSLHQRFVRLVMNESTVSFFYFTSQQNQNFD